MAHTDSQSHSLNTVLYRRGLCDFYLIKTGPLWCLAVVATHPVGPTSCQLGAARHLWVIAAQHPCRLHQSQVAGGGGCRLGSMDGAKA